VQTEKKEPELRKKRKIKNTVKEGGRISAKKKRKTDKRGTKEEVSGLRNSKKSISNRRAQRRLRSDCNEVCSNRIQRKGTVKAPEGRMFTQKRDFPVEGTTGGRQKGGA